MDNKPKGIYIGNRLLKRNYLSIVDQIGGGLSERYNMVLASSKENKALRLIDMCLTVIKHAKSSEFLIVDVFSTQSFYFAAIIAGLCRTLKLPYITILRGGNLPNRLKQSRKKSDTLFNNAVINIAPSGYLLEEFQKYGYNVKYIPNPAFLKKLSFKQRKKLAPKLLYVRALKKIYNPVMAVEVVNILKDKFPDIELMVYGSFLDESHEQVKERISKYNLQDKITLFGAISQEKWFQNSAEYDIFINTTNFDNTPMSVIQAMALGLPVVSTNVGGIPYLLNDGKNALLVDKENPEMMAEKIAELLNNPETAESLSHQGREFSKSLDWDTQVKQKWFDTLDTIIKNNKAKK